MVTSMKIREGLYLFNRKDCTTSISDATKLVHFLTADITSGTPQIHWGFHPERGNMNVFIGTGLDGGKNRVVIQKNTLKDGLDVLFEFYEGPILQYSVTDLCFEPEKSFLLQLYVQVAPRVIEATLINRNGAKIRRSFQTE